MIYLYISAKQICFHKYFPVTFLNTIRSSIPNTITLQEIPKTSIHFFQIVQYEQLVQVCGIHKVKIRHDENCCKNNNNKKKNFETYSNPV